MRRSSPLLPASLVGLIGGTILLTGCFTTSSDYQRDAEKFIVGDENLRTELFDEGASATSFTSATCEDPESQDVGTTFMCTAQDDAGGDWEFEIEIQESNAYDIKIARQP
jgi:hypothetical protein